MKNYQKNLELAKIEIKNLDCISQKLKKINKKITLFESKFEDLDYDLYKQIDYKFNNYNLNIIIKKIYKLLLHSFISMKSLISKPVFEITSNKVIIHLFFYNFLYFKNTRKIRNKKIRNKINKNFKENKNFYLTYENRLEILCKILERIFKKPIELDLVRLYYPYFDSNIFINIIDRVINKVKIRKRINKFYKKSTIVNPINDNKYLNHKDNDILPTFISGINFNIGGRLLRGRIVPRKTALTFRKGTLTRNKFNFLDQARYISKNKRGGYSVTINTGQFIK
jgi:hypothetical protein